MCMLQLPSTLLHVSLFLTTEFSLVHESFTNSSSQESQPALRQRTTSTASSTNTESTNVLSSQHSFQQLSSSELASFHGPGIEATSEQQELLNEDVRNIMLTFGRFVTKTRDSVEKRILVGKFATSILALKAYEPAPEERDQSLLDEHREEIKKATSISEIFSILCAYWNYLNYEILEYIIDLYGTDDDKERLTSYNEELHKFFERRFFELSMTPMQKKFVVKLNIREGTTLKQAFRIRGRIAKILHVNLAALTIVDVRPGCVQLTFLIPKFIAQKVFPLSDEQTFALSKDLSVMRIECGDYVFKV